jgi:hypothetical protein
MARNILMTGLGVTAADNQDSLTAGLHGPDPIKDARRIKKQETMV